jgi:hypothetical protein
LLGTGGSEAGGLSTIQQFFFAGSHASAKIFARSDLEITDITSARDEARGPEINGYALQIEQGLSRAESSSFPSDTMAGSRSNPQRQHQA